MSVGLGRQGTRGGAASRGVVYSLFFLSGLAALVDEASWSRMIGLTIGHTAQGAALVLAAYFVGLAIGQFLGGAVRFKRPLLYYGLAELIAAAWTCVIPTLLNWVGSPVGQSGLELFRNSSAGRATWCFLVLLPATIPLGATLPLVADALASVHSFGRRSAFAYGLNTFGGLVGIVTASAFLLVVAGVRTSGYLAATLSAACGVTACLLACFQRRTDQPRPATDGAAHRPDGSTGWWILAAISGFGTLGLEVLYTRMFSLIFHNSTYTFGAVVAVFLLALCLGTVLASWLGTQYAPRQIAAASFWLGSLALAISVALFPRLTGLHYFTFGTTFASYLLGVFGLVSVFVLPPITLLGMTLPAALQAARGGQEVGRVTAANTLAGAAGAIAAGFLLPQWVGLWSAFGLFVALFGVVGAVLLIKGSIGRLKAVGVLTMTVIAVVLGSGLAVPARNTSGGEILRRWESEYGWVDVVRVDESGGLAVRQNLHYQHGSTGNAICGGRQGRLPLLLHPRPAEVALLGLGTGVSAAPVVVDPSVGRALVIELIPEVVEATRMLKSSNLGVVDDPKVEVRVDDARHSLLRTPRQFDVIVSDLLIPWESRAGYLYTVEFYQGVRRRLRPGGLFCQWLPLYQLGPDELELIADSIAHVFPHTTIWWGQFDRDFPIIALVGSEEPLEVDLVGLELRPDAFHELPGGADPDLNKPADLPGLYLGSWPRNRSHRLNTDEHPWLEFTAPLSHRSGRALIGLELLRYFDQILSKLPTDSVRFVGELSELDREDERRRAIQRMSLFGDVLP